MKSTIIKRSIVLKGRKTSVSLELTHQIDKDRNGGNLSSAIRVFVFNHLRAASPRSPMLNEEKLKDRAANGRHAQ